MLWELTRPGIKGWHGAKFAVADHTPLNVGQIAQLDSIPGVDITAARDILAETGRI